MGQYITISVETLSSYLSITNEGDEHHTGSYDTSLTRPNDYVGNNMDIHDCTFHLIFTWIIAPTNKHSGFCHTDYWMWHCFRTNHPFNLASINFLNLLEVVRLSMSSNKTLHYDTFLSHIFHTHIINVSVDPSRAIISFIDISTAHSCNWKLDDEENWVCKFDWQSSAAQASTVPPVAPQSSDVPRSPHDAYPTLLALPSLCTTRLRRRSMGCRWKSMHALMH
ncbi:hypothetical protein Gogos_010139 [Gossypium gossypioides]|uniref:Uncharacterized protein n=1 Tax=Gossypium gossypioides TaxID=34282 RepID=A0A7J9BKA8_GOSGO|nr:hypothetical protein [Gossypium gossypioides]